MAALNPHQKSLDQLKVDQGNEIKNDVAAKQLSNPQAPKCSGGFVGHHLGHGSSEGHTTGNSKESHGVKAAMKTRSPITPGAVVPVATKPRIGLRQDR